MVDVEAPVASVVVPAHDEEAVLGRLLGALCSSVPLEVVVVSNGSSDRTAEIARRFPGVRVVEIAQASKRAALIAGDAVATSFPRFYVDADVELDADGVLTMCGLLGDGVLAVGPTRVIDTVSSSKVVQAYYRIWQGLPANGGLHGRGAVGVAAKGHARVAEWPELMADDLFLSSAFAPSERAIAPVPVVIHAPRATGDLVRRRVRASSGNREHREWRRGRGEEGGGTTTSTAAHLARLSRSPRRWPDIAVFVGVVTAGRVVGRLRGRRGRLEWLRDESSRVAAR